METRKEAVVSTPSDDVFDKHDLCLHLTILLNTSHDQEFTISPTELTKKFFYYFDPLNNGVVPNSLVQNHVTNMVTLELVEDLLTFHSPPLDITRQQFLSLLTAVGLDRSQAQIQLVMIQAQYSPQITGVELINWRENLINNIFKHIRHNQVEAKLQELYRRFDVSGKQSVGYAEVRVMLAELNEVLDDGMYVCG